MTSITTLSQFLTAANTQFMIFDLGRRVQQVNREDFVHIEQLNAPYPYPIQGHGQFAVVFWGASGQHYIWFIKFPLDERGLFMSAVQGEFMEMVLTALGQDPSGELTEQQQEQLANHKFSFKPDQQKLAIFNAKVKQELKQSPSHHYDDAYHYLSEPMSGEQNWQHIGLQGLADVTVRCHEAQQQQAVISGLEHGALQVQIALCQCLEHVELPEKIARILLQKLLTSEPAQRLNFLRALASSVQYTAQAVMFLHQSEQLDGEALISIGGRNWLVLEQDEIRALYLEALAEQNNTVFGQLFSDLVSIPVLRPLLLAEIRNPNRSSKLSAAIGSLFQQVSRK